MTEIRESNFGIDLPGEWVELTSEEPGVFLFEEQGGSGRLRVTLLAVRPMFAIADQQRLLADYMRHRATYERGQVPTLDQSEPVVTSAGDPIVGGWSGVDLDTGARTLHHIVLLGGLLAHFALQSTQDDEETFLRHAEEVLSTAQVTAP